MIAVPVDVDMDKLAPKLEDIEQRITPNVLIIMEITILTYIDKSHNFELYFWSNFLH